jgi:hypothetical protein
LKRNELRVKKRLRTRKKNKNGRSESSVKRMSDKQAQQSQQESLAFLKWKKDHLATVITTNRSR